MSPTTVLIYTGIALGIAYFFWHFINSQNASTARRKRQRRSDRLRLNPQQKKVYAEAQRLFKEGKLKNCAKLLENLGMTREAISILEKGNHINDAANILLRIHRPNRAGNIYARHGYWKEAAECYKKAGLANEVGRCSREAGDNATATAYFLEAKNYEEAADCLTELGKHRDAAKLYAKLGKHETALEQYQIMIDKNPHFYSLDLSKDEIKIITTYLSKGMGDIRLADIQSIKDQMVDVIVSLVKRSKFDMAQKIYQRTNSDIGPQLIAQEDLSTEETEMIAKVFYNGSAFEYAGMVFERLGMYEQAADAFEKAEDYERAAYCFERAGKHDRATAMRIKLASTGEIARKPIQAKSGNENDGPLLFAMGNSTHFERGSDDMFSEADPENTTVLAKPAGRPPKAPSDVPAPELAHLNELQPKPSPSNDHIPSSKPASEDNQLQWQNFWEADFLRDLTTEQKELFKSAGKMQSFPKGSLILDYDEEPLGIYFVLAGSVQVFKRIKQEETQLDDLQPPESFGEFWLLIDQPSRVRFVADSLCEILTISRPDFEAIMDRNGTVARKLYKRFTQRLLDKLLREENDREKLAAS